ncbi:MAG: alpha-ketoacid dehydrogenase subunit beta [Novosphingobium sp.]|nr:alpha-ketoacid dehydrogenase subunit beta [Novosphingobium sp.]MCP5402824.1 alpha-ketoacid dehydrogenase subunit beta [Novosphingobium sp.]
MDERPKAKGRKVLMNRAIREALDYELANDPSVFLMGEDLGAFGGVYQTAAGLIEKYGEERVRDTPISEAGFMAAAAGAAMAGMKPVVELMFVDFMGVCLDPIYNFIAKHATHTGGKQAMPVTIMAGMGGGYSDASQHSQTLFATFAHLPGLKIVAPSTAYDARGLLHAAIRDPNPVMFLMQKELLGLGLWGTMPEASSIMPDEPFELPIGKAFVRRKGSDITLVGMAATAHMAARAADQLAEEGIEAEVIDLATISPLDRETILTSVEKTGRLLVADEDYRNCGVAGEVIASVAETIGHRLKAPPRRVAFPDTPIPFARPLEQALRPSTDKIVETTRQLFKEFA